MAAETEKWYYVGDLRIKARRSVSDRSCFGLSPREITVCCYLARGAKVSEIAKDMNVSGNTVNTYKARIFRKLNVSTTAEAAAIVTAFVCGGTIEGRASGDGYIPLYQSENEPQALQATG